MDFIKEKDLAGYNPARPHSLRSGFRSRLTGKVADPLIEFMMGHALGEQVRAYINLPEEEFRELYMDAEKYLAIEKTSREELEERKGKVLKVSDEYEKRIEKLEGYIEVLRTQNKGLELEQKKLNGVKAENLELKSRVARLELETTEKTGRLKKVEAEVLKLKEAVEKLLET